MVLLPLQAVPGGAELLIIFAIAAISFLLGIALTYWVYSDAKKRGNDNASLWGIVTFLGFFLGGILGFGVVAVYVIVGRE